MIGVQAVVCIFYSLFEGRVSDSAARAAVASHGAACAQKPRLTNGSTEARLASFAWLFECCMPRPVNRTLDAYALYWY